MVGLFYSSVLQHGDAVAFIDGHRTVTYLQLQQKIDDLKQQLPPQKQLVVIKASNDLATMVAYLACLQAGHPALMVDAQLSDDYLRELTQCYSPNWLIHGGDINKVSDYSHTFDNDLALLLSTSGSTGSPKQVALSVQNLQSNAAAICQYLPLLASDKTITTLAPFYSYGLSVLNSHLLSGATIVLTETSLISREFWELFERHQISSFAGVPYSYDMLLRLRFTHKSLPYLRYFTQAGGKLSPEKVSALASYARQQDKQFFVMYGQTEATARMAFNADPIAKPDSIGKPIPGGRFLLQDEQGKSLLGHDEQGELIYHGENIMLGYTRDQSDLSQFKQADFLATGDLAYRDKQGDYFISGRLKRFIKPFGVRLNLDEVETRLADKDLIVAAVGDDSKLQVGIEKKAGAVNDIKAIQQTLSQQLSLHPSVIQVKEFDSLPLTASNKRDYAMLQTWFNPL